MDRRPRKRTRSKEPIVKVSASIPGYSHTLIPSSIFAIQYHSIQTKTHSTKAKSSPAISFWKVDSVKSMTSLARTETRLGRAAAMARESFEENFMALFGKDERKEME